MLLLLYCCFHAKCYDELHNLVPPVLIFPTRNRHVHPPFHKTVHIPSVWHRWQVSFTRTPSSGKPQAIYLITTICLCLGLTVTFLYYRHKLLLNVTVCLEYHRSFLQGESYCIKQRISIEKKITFNRVLLPLKMLLGNWYLEPPSRRMKDVESKWYVWSWINLCSNMGILSLNFTLDQINRYVFTNSIYYVLYVLSQFKREFNFPWFT